ncbi:ABC transporter substrate-binding protein [Faecalicatena sp. AGMB00832]|uniref:ABC transporter substrate-binding protein n=1 Tax=Faecalicatena faecalis TaxID=2726362 RepID=A0ABS6D8F7_9FIRM|nr:ABC transporter substrate-binding protein [Faecalicatena faecalis]MBU3877897.1 ABC transporter substrate-binding protein [Faecalicatena faecalis]
MKKATLKKAFTVTLSAAMVLSLAACGNSKKEKPEKEVMDVTIDQIKLGEDYTDLKADLKFLTHKTDVVDTTFKQYIEEFQKLYPNINIEYEGITDYANDITTRLTTGDWGDICMIPTTVDKDELGNYFTKLGDKKALSDIYEGKFLEAYSYEGTSYGIPSMANVQGVVYNKAVFEKAGIKDVPKTPEEFLGALQKIKDNTDAIPLYTNFAAGWTMTAWDAYIDGGATGDPDFAYEGLTKGENPFSDRGDGTGPYAVYDTLYEAVKQGLTEEDPTTTDWEGSKGMMNKGEIGCMALGSWSITQIQQAGENADDIGYMTFPITVEGKQYASAGGDYNYGINCNSSKDNQIAAMCYIKWLVEKSGFAQSEGGLSAVIGDEYPEALSALDGIELVVNNPAPDEDANLFNDVNNDSELGINVSGAIPTEIIEEATGGTKTMDDLVNEWNERWTTAQEANGITH